ncbi:MAG: FISUMP domain-containing protein [Bacteroidota bacterium]
MKHLILLFSLLSFGINDLQTTSNEYPQVQIGEQVWMTQNLQVVVFQNGDSLFHAETPEAWIQCAQNQTPAYCLSRLDSTTNHRDIIYNWWAVNDDRSIAPEGWKVASDEDFRLLLLNLGVDEKVEFMKILGEKQELGRDLMSAEQWIPEKRGNNLFGFEALPNDWVGHLDGLLKPARPNTYALFWTTTPRGDEMAIVYRLDHRGVMQYLGWQGAGYAVRCLRE